MHRDRGTKADISGQAATWTGRVVFGTHKCNTKASNLNSNYYYFWYIYVHLPLCLHGVVVAIPLFRAWLTKCNSEIPFFFGFSFSFFLCFSTSLCHWIPFVPLGGSSTLCCCNVKKKKPKNLVKTKGKSHKIDSNRKFVNQLQEHVFTQSVGLKCGSWANWIVPKCPPLFLKI